MHTATLPYKLIKKVRDGRFDEEMLHRHNLLLQFGLKDFQVAVVDAEEKKLMWLEDYVLPHVQHEEDLLEVLDAVFDSHELLKAGFWNQIKISVKNTKFVQVPQALFIPEALADYLQLNAAIDRRHDTLNYVENPLSGAMSVFAMREDMKRWLERLYPSKNPVVMHQSACLIETIMRYAASRDDNPLYIYVDRFKLHILSCHEGRLVYYNQFAIRQFPDYVKFIMLVMKTLGMDQQNSQVVLWGYIGQNSPHYHEFYKYIKNVSFGPRPDFLQFGFEFDEIQDHYFADLYGMYLIG